MPYPRWLKKPLPKSAAVRRLRPYLGDLSTVCESALCPNRGECFVRQTVTFLLLGNSCTRRCSFCAVAKAPPEPVDENEPEKVAQAAARLGLKHIVLTSVTRDDLPDGGAAHFARTVLAVQKLLPRATVEVLTPDFQGDFSALDTVLAARPAVYNHNIETVPRLYPEIRPQADYVRSLRLLAGAAQKTLAKSGLMLGLGETETELKSALKDLKNAGVSVVTLGQYLAPSAAHYPVREFVPPEKFAEYKNFGEKTLGFRAVFAGPFVRSSYLAKEVLNVILTPA